MKKGVDYVGISVITMCHDGAGKYLIGLRSDKCRDEHNRWDPIGSGGVEFGDTVEETIKKEVKEECDADVLEIEELGWYETFREHDGHKTHWVQFAYKVKIDPTQVKIMEPEKCLELRWCTLAEIPEPQHSQFPRFLEMYKDKL